MPWLADTNVLSELVRPRPNAGVLQWAASVGRVALSVVTVEEIMFGLTWKPNEKIRAFYQRFFEDCEVIAITEAIAHQAGAMRGRLQAQGITRTQADMLIAATAQIHGLTLVTRNERDFEGLHIAVFNPFV